MTDEQQQQERPETDPACDACDAFGEWVMRNKTGISIISIFVLMYISKYLGWLHH